MAARRAKRIGRIQCAANAATVNKIAQSGGLTAEPSERLGEYFLVDSGRNLASEVAPALLAAVAGHLDNAVEKGIIPHWSLVEPKSHGPMPQFMGITHLLAF
jgi:hypothetical protein